MYSHKVALALAPLFLLARADVQLDNDDVPSACRSICAPIVTLGNRCEVDLNGDDNDRIEDNLESQCFCLNDSFDVANIAGLCAGCISANQNTNSNDDDADDGRQDISEILYTCGWSSSSWSSSQTTAASGITVVATAPTATSQLTTTIVPGATATRQSSSTTATGTSTNGNSGSTTDSTNGGTSTSTTTSTSSSDENGAGSLAPFGVAGAAVAFAALLLA